MNKLLYRITCGAMALYLKTFRGFKIFGSENVPKQGKLIIVANHISNIDPIVLGSSVPRFIQFMAKKELFKFSPFGWLLKRVGAFPVSRGKADLEAIKTSLKILRQGKVLGLFPEGTRHQVGKLGRAHPGLVTIALKTKAPIIPCALTNTYGGKPVIVRVGKPIELKEYYNRKINKEEIEEAGKKIMKKISELLKIDAK